MPKLQKQALSQFLRVSCDRYLYNSLKKTDPEEDHILPLSGRPGVAAFRARGIEFENQKFEELSDVFGDSVTNITKLLKGSGKSSDQLLDEQLSVATAPHFFVEPQLSESEFRATFLDSFKDLPISVEDYPDISDLRPDLIELVDIQTLPDEHLFEVTKDGSVKPFTREDSRAVLRVIDLKATEHLNSSYASEVVAYSFVLSAWLNQGGVADQYIVLGFPGIWVKSTYFDHKLPSSTASSVEKISWVQSQIELADCRLYGPVVKKFFENDVPRVITVNDWRSDLDWGVIPSCSQCDYLGFPAWSRRPLSQAVGTAEKLGWIESPKLDDYCYTECLDHGLAMQIPGMTKGMRKTLEKADQSTLTEVADLTVESTVMAKHNGLKREAKSIPRRASSIISDEIDFHEGYQNFQLANYVDLRLTLNISFDASTEMLVSIGLGVDFREPTKYGEPKPNDLLQKKEVLVFFVDKPSPQDEREALLDFLRYISYLVQWTRDKKSYSSDGDQRSSYAKDNLSAQAVFWDEKQEMALRNAIGRHLHFLTGFDVVKEAFWLFPPESFVGVEATTTSPFSCFLSDTLSAYCALPTRISDDLVSCADYLIDDFESNLSAFQWDVINGMIPRERSMEIWQDLLPKNPPKSRGACVDQYKSIMRTLVHSMRRLVFHLSIEHKEVFKGKAPTLKDIKPLARTGVSKDGILWLSHLAFDEGVGRMQSQLNMSEDPYVSESCYNAIRVVGLDNSYRTEFLKINNIDGLVGVFKTREQSKFAKFKNGQGFLCILPESISGVSNLSLKKYIELVDPDFDLDSLSLDYGTLNSKISRLLSISIVFFDRKKHRLVVQFSQYWEWLWRLLIQKSLVRLNEPMVVVESEGLSDLQNVVRVAKAIGNPAIAIPSPETEDALFKINRKPGKSKVTPAAEILWEPWRLVNEQSLELSEVEPVLEQIVEGLDYAPNPSQIESIKKTLTTRLSLVWGGPGTGKTQTLALSIICDLISRKRAGKANRALIVGPTYRSVQEVANRVSEIWKTLSPELQSEFNDLNSFFLSSTKRFKELWNELPESQFINSQTTVYDGNEGYFNGEADDNLGFESIKNGLLKPTSPCLVFSTMHGLFKLITGQDKDAQALAPLFDRLWLDESSQMPVSKCMSVLASGASNCSVALFGDRLQMPPILNTKPPEGAEHMVGSVHQYLLTRILHDESFETGDVPKFEEHFLDTNYRSCEPIVRFSHRVGYRNSFRSFNPEKSLNYTPLSSEPNWDQDIVAYQSGFHEEVLNPERPCVSVIYDDGTNGQSNIFEAMLVVGTLLTYRESMIQQAQEAGELFDETNFWEKQVGIVTPHKAQRATILMILEDALDGNVDLSLVDAAIDTVERFQGGEREMVIVSFGVGDPDLVRNEEEFIFQKERINVAITRAKSKVILFVTNDIAYHLSSEESVIEASRVIKDYVFQHTDEELDETVVEVDGELRDVKIRYCEYGLR